MSLVASARGEFPQIHQDVRGRRAVYLDSAATALKPQVVIDRMSSYLSGEVANIHRASHYWAARGTEHYEEVRTKVARMLNARNPEEIVFTRGTTEGLNLLAQTLTAQFLSPGDEILLTEMEHHSNIVPWQLAAASKGIKVSAVRVMADGELDLGDLRSKLTDRVKLVSVVHCSNVLGTVNPVKEIVELARTKAALTVVDAAQSVSLGLADVQSLACDFLVFSGHKIYGPTGVGVVYGRKEVLGQLPPYQGGGSMIQTVTFDHTTYLGLPHRFEAGTPAIAEVIGLGAAIDFISRFEPVEIVAHGRELTREFLAGLKEIGGFRVYGTSPSRVSQVSFNLEGVHASDVGQLLDEQGVAVRTGHLCCQPLMARLGVEGVVRASFGIYSDLSDVNACLQALRKAKGILL